MISKPTKKQRKELKDFKFRVKLAVYNAQMLKNVSDRKMPYEVIIGRTTFIFDPAIWRSRTWTAAKEIEKTLNKFTTTKW